VHAFCVIFSALLTASLTSRRRLYATKQHTGRTVVENGDWTPPVESDDIDGDPVEVGAARSHGQQVVRHKVFRRRVAEGEVWNAELLRGRQHRLHVRTDDCRCVRRSDFHVRWISPQHISNKNSRNNRNECSTLKTLYGIQSGPQKVSHYQVIKQS